jgi:UPF0271 protein
MAARIDLNADVGESWGAFRVGDDAALLPLVSSANLACGFHGGDPLTLRRTLELCARHGVAVGAHPSHADLRGFGRRELPVEPDELEADLLYQVAALQGLARSHGLALRHVKPHGALYNQAARDERVARCVARAVALLDRGLVLVGLAGSNALGAAAAAEGLRFVGEAFADRGYAPDGALLPRGTTGALLGEPAAVAAQAVSIARDGCVCASDGSRLAVAAETLCLHGDSPGAPALAAAVRAALLAAGVSIQPLSA